MTREEWLGLADWPPDRRARVSAVQLQVIRENRETLARLAPECDDYDALAARMLDLMNAEHRLSAAEWIATPRAERDAIQERTPHRIWSDSISKG